MSNEIINVPQDSPQDQAGAAMYNRRQVTNTYRREEGVIVLPLASPGRDGRTCEIVRVHQPVAVRDVTFEASRQMCPPTVPGVIPGSGPDGDARDCLISREVNIPSPGLVQSNAGGVPVWTLTGKQMYVQKIPRSDSDGYETAAGYVTGMSDGALPPPSDSNMLAIKGALAGNKYCVWLHSTVGGMFFDEKYLTSHPVQSSNS